MKIKKYTNEDDQFLVENYYKYGSKYCATNLGRTSSGITNRAHKLGIKGCHTRFRNKIMENLACGQRFGKLIILNDPPFRKNDGNMFWKCKCDCGNLTDVSGYRLIMGQKSCGCMSGNHKHGLGRNGKFAANYIMWRSAKIRAKRSKLPFTITPDDIIIPDKCPLLGISIFKSGHSAQDNSPTLDRIDNSKGYVPENVWVISYRANRSKGNLIFSELKMLIENLEQKIVEQKIHETRKG